MSLRSSLAAIGLLVLFTSAADAASTRESLATIGTSATKNEINGWHLDVTPNGDGLPEGSGSAAVGAKIFAEKCAACHGVAALGTKVPGRGPYPRLVGGFGTLTAKKPIKTVGSYWPYATGIFDYIRRAMPLYSPGSLSSEEVYALTAFILAKNKAIPSNEIMNAATLPKVKMANAKNFFVSQEAIRATTRER